METGPIRDVGGRKVGAGQPVYVIGEIGINHNGSLEIAKKMIDGAVRAGADAVKFQKRTPELCTPREQWDVERDTPWGRMKYIEYRRKVEFGVEEYAEINRYCKELGIQWFASCWDEKSVEFIDRFEPPCYKVASASVTDGPLLSALKATKRPIIMSTGMSTMQQIDRAVDVLGQDGLLLAHSTSAYPCPLECLNLKMIGTLAQRYPRVPIGYSGHEVGLSTTWAAVALGATHIERHITLDRAMWGSDQAASVEMGGFERLIANIRDIEKSLGDGKKQVYECELKPKKKLRRFDAILDVSA